MVNGLGNLDSILPAASALAKGHVAYGVKPAHYTPVGEALLWTLEHGLGPDWTPELKSAWSAAYATLAKFMIAEAYGCEAAADELMRTAGATHCWGHLRADEISQ